MSDQIEPQISADELLLLQVIQRQSDRRRKDKYRDSDRYPQEELRRAIQETVALHLQAYLEVESQRGNITAAEVLMRQQAQPLPWALPRRDRYSRDQMDCTCGFATACTQTRFFAARWTQPWHT
jgi:hypothetical protein